VEEPSGQLFKTSVHDSVSRFFALLIAMHCQDLLPLLEYEYPLAVPGFYMEASETGDETK
jgi:hypothetical protein